MAPTFDRLDLGWSFTILKERRDTLVVSHLTAVLTVRSGNGGSDGHGNDGGNGSASDIGVNAGFDNDRG